MKRLMFFLFALSLAAPSILTGGAQAGETRAGDLTLTDAWLRLNIADRPAAAYVEIANAGQEGDRLLAVSTPLAAKAELHGHEMRDGQMSMIMLESVEIPAGETVAFEAGGLHVMVFGLLPSVKAGDIIPLTFTFEKAGAVGVGAEVKPLGGE